MNSTTILDALQDLQLLGNSFRRNWRGADTWKAWRAFLAALFGLPLDDEALETFRKHTGRTVAPAEPSSECWCICGRRSGKSLVAAAVGTYLAAFRDYAEFRVPGETLVLPIIAPDRRQCRTILGYVAGFFESSPVLAALVRKKFKEAVELTNGVRIEVHTASFRTVRGYTAIGAIVDEAAFLRSDESASPDTELLAALGPAMATIPGALLLGISSPYSRRGELWRNFKLHYGKDDAPVLVWRASSREMNPTLSRAIVAAAYLRDPASAAAEYGGEFRSDVSGFLSPEIVDAVVVQRRFELPFSSEHNYVGFCDPSGGASDSFTLAVAHLKNEVAILDLIREVPPPFSPETVCKEFAETLRGYHVFEVEGDRYGGEFPRELFAKHGVAYRVAEKNRSEIYLDFLPAVMSSRVELLSNCKLISQLCALERRTGRNRDVVDHPPGGHDDVSNAAAGAVVKALGNTLALGYVEFLKAIAAGTIPSPEEQPQIAKSFRDDLLRWQQRKQPSFTPETPRPEPEALGACESCGSNLLVRIGGCGVRCNQCGATVGEKNAFVVATFGPNGRPTFKEIVR